MSVVADERSLTFPCDGDMLVGILHIPSSPSTLGMVIVVGGPQYRVGSHRQFVLLARELAARGIAVLRFDCRGMGDSGGEFPGFEHIEPDVAAAVEALVCELPSIRHITLWGLCDASLAISMHAHRDRRITGIVLLNPWIRADAALARARLKHYYLARLIQPDFLRKVLKAEFNPIRSGWMFAKNIVDGFGLSPGRWRSADESTTNAIAERMVWGLQHFTGQILVILSGRDLTAREFEEAARRSKRWRQLFAKKRGTQRWLPEADHTFSRRTWHEQVVEWTWEWIRQCRGE